jgi:hypothetical protein
MIDLKNRILFVHVPKAAGTSVEEYFRQLRGLDEVDIPALGIFKNAKASNLERGNQHCSLEMYEKYYFGGPVPEDWRLFTVVRNPYNRFWSEWKYRRLPPPQRFYVSTLLSVPMLIRLSEKPIERLKDLNSHMRPQSTYVTGLSRDRLRILKFENITQEFSQLCRDWDLPDTGLPRSNPSPKRKPPSQEHVALGNDFVRRAYAADFETLAYDIDTPTVPT